MKYPKNFCPAPFTTLIINADGKVGCCRERGTEHSIGNAFEESIDEIWNGEKIKKWRKEFLEGNPVTCQRELNDMSCNLFKHNMELLPYVELTEEVRGPILRLSPDINGKCNLKCPMCIVWKKPNGKYDEDSDFWDSLEANVLPNLKIMDPLAGEPFIQEDLYKIIRMTSKVNPNCRWNFTTNAQWELDEFKISHLDMIEIDLISVSVDSVNHQTYQRIRRGGQLQDLKRNLVKLIEYRDNRKNKNGNTFNLMLNFTIQKENAYEISEMLDYCKKINISPMFLFLYDPSEMSLESWSEDEKIQFLNFYFNSLSKNDLIICNRIFNAVIRSLQNQVSRNKLEKFYNLVTDGVMQKLSSTSKNGLVITSDQF